MKREECEECDGNVGNRRGYAGNLDGDLGIAVEITQSCSRNDKLKERREVKMIENN